MDDSSFNDPVSVPPQDSKNIALLMWLGTIFFGFIPGLVVYLLKTEDRYLADQSKEALNWSITVIIGCAVAWILCLILIGFLMLPLIGLINFIFCIMGVVAVSTGKWFRVPFSLRLIQ